MGKRQIHPVLELIQKRHASNSTPGTRSDGYKLGLAIEGGGMRGLVTSGMSTAIERLGLLKTFDIVYGTSAGAFNGAYLVAGQANYGGTIYYQNINNRKFIDPYRLLIPGKDIMSLEYLVYDVAVKQKVLDCEAIIKSPIPLVILVSSVTKLRAVRFRDFSSPEEIYRVLLATARMPVIAGPPVDINGDLFYDGGVFEGIPFRSAIEEGCSHVLVLLSRPPGRPLLEPRAIEKIMARLLLRKYPRINEALEARREKYTQDLVLLEAKIRTADGPPYIYTVQPLKDSEEVHRLERSRAKLIAGAIAGFTSVYRLFSTEDFRVHELLDVFSPEGKRLDSSDHRRD